MNIDDYLKIFNNISDELPSDIDPELKADVNSLAQNLKSKIEENKTAVLDGRDLVHTAENTKAETDYLINKFKAKHGTKSNR